MNDLQIRCALIDDLPEVQTLLSRASLPLDGVTDFFPASYAVGVRGVELVAAIGVERYGQHGLLRSAVVAEKVRGSGIGSQLAAERLNWSKAEGLQDVYLLTTTASPFFAKLGFVPVQRTQVPAEIAAAPEFASICPSTAVVMRYDLS